MDRIEYTPLKPNVGQATFLEYCANPYYNVNMYMGGWGAGKTQCETQVLTDVAVTIPGSKIAVVRKVRADIKETIWSEFLATVHPHLVCKVRESDLEIDMFCLDGRYTSTIYFKGMDNVTRWGSTFYNLILVDEANELKKKEFVGLLGRLRHKFHRQQIDSILNQENPNPYLSIRYLDDGTEEIDVHRFLCAAFNPQSDDHWLYEYCEQNKPDRSSFVISPTRDNWENLPYDYRVILENLDEATKNVFVEANWGPSLDGVPCTPAFSKSCIFDSPLPSYPLELFCGWDFGFTHPSFSILRIDQGVIYKEFELLGTRVHLIDFIKKAKTLMNQFHPESEFTHWLDHIAANQESDKSEKTSRQILQAEGIIGHSKYSRPIDRAVVINDLFKTGRFFVHERCRKSRTTYTNGWHFVEGKGDVIDKDPSNPYHNIADSDGFAIFGIVGPDRLQNRSRGRGLVRKPDFQGLHGAFRTEKEQYSGTYQERKNYRNG